MACGSVESQSCKQLLACLSRAGWGGWPAGQGSCSILRGGSAWRCGHLIHWKSACVMEGGRRDERWLELAKKSRLWGITIIDLPAMASEAGITRLGGAEAKKLIPEGSTHQILLTDLGGAYV